MRKLSLLKRIGYASLLSILTLTAFIGCTDLDENPTEAVLSPDILTSEETLQAAVAGMYRQLFDGARWNAYYIAGYGGDDITTHSALNKIGLRESDWRRQTPDSERLIDNGGGSYGASYNVIRTANSIIENRDNITGGTQEGIDRLMGETFFLRAFSYFHLTRTYGEVPIINSSTTIDEIQKATFLEVYEQIESDLIQAETLLPDVYPDIPVVGARPSKGAASAYLAKLYLHWGGFPINDGSRYAMAAAKAREVIDNEGVYGYGLTDNFRGLWTVANRFSQNESVFAMVTCLGCGNLGNRTTGRLGLPGDAGGWRETFGEITFYNDMEADALANGTEQRFSDTFADDVLPRASNPDASDWENFSDEPHPVYRKVVGGDYAETINTTNNDINRYFMRYAEVLLTYAEASARAGSSGADAWEALNRVRRRAGATVDITSGDLAELAFQERGWELAGEFERWHDLVRTDRVVEFLERRSPNERVDVVNNIAPLTSGEFLYFSPIPRQEINLAPQLGE
ncbi:MAG: RagB/SusD family nutrient uptake outer membrane protein [Bacteroidota bacterium]